MSEIYNLKNEKTHDFCQSYFATKLPKEKFNILCSNSNDKSEPEDNLACDLLIFTKDATHDFGRPYFKSLDKITFCRICSIEINKSLLYDHIYSKEHKDIEDYFIRKCMTYCGKCNKEIKNDEWREHTLSEEHLKHYGTSYCDICKLT